MQLWCDSWPEKRSSGAEGEADGRGLGKEEENEPRVLLPPNGTVNR